MVRRPHVHWLFAALMLFSSGCPRVEQESSCPAFIRHSLPEGVTLEYERNGVIVPRSLSFGHEWDGHPGLQALRTREGLEQVIAAGQNEFEQMLLLNDWVNAQWTPGEPVPYPPWDANRILELIRAGQTKGFCAQYAVVLVQACLSLGWSARYLSLAEEHKPLAGHMTVEVWSNQYDKWVVLDPYFDVHFAEQGIPLSALELHTRLVQGKTSAVQIIPGHSPHRPQEINPAYLLSLYYHLAVDLRNNHLSRPLHFWNRNDEYLSWRDTHTAGRPEIFTMFTSDTQEFNFPLNQVQVSFSAGPEPDMLRARMRTNMPDAERIMLRENSGSWEKSTRPYYPDSEGELKISAELDPCFGSVLVCFLRLKPGLNRLEFRALSRSGRQGPSAEFHVRYTPRP